MFLDPPSTLYIPLIGTMYPYLKGTRRVLVQDLGICVLDCWSKVPFRKGPST